MSHQALSEIVNHDLSNKQTNDKGDKICRVQPTDEGKSHQCVEQEKEEGMQYNKAQARDNDEQPCSLLDTDGRYTVLCAEQQSDCREHLVGDDQLIGAGDGVVLAVQHTDDRTGEFNDKRHTRDIVNKDQHGNDRIVDDIKQTRDQGIADKDQQRNNFGSALKDNLKTRQEVIVDKDQKSNDVGSDNKRNIQTKNMRTVNNNQQLCTVDSVDKHIQQTSDDTDTIVKEILQTNAIDSVVELIQTTDQGRTVNDCQYIKANHTYGVDDELGDVEQANELDDVVCSVNNKQQTDDLDDLFSDGPLTNKGGLDIVAPDAQQISDGNGPVRNVNHNFHGDGVLKVEQLTNDIEQSNDTGSVPVDESYCSIGEEDTELISEVGGKTSDEQTICEGNCHRDSPDAVETITSDRFGSHNKDSGDGACEILGSDRRQSNFETSEEKTRPTSNNSHLLTTKGKVECHLRSANIDEIMPKGQVICEIIRRLNTALVKNESRLLFARLVLKQLKENLLTLWGKGTTNLYIDPVQNIFRCRNFEMSSLAVTYVLSLSSSMAKTLLEYPNHKRRICFQCCDKIKVAAKDILGGYKSRCTRKLVQSAVCEPDKLGLQGYAQHEKQIECTEEHKEIDELLWMMNAATFFCESANKYKNLVHREVVLLFRVASVLILQHFQVARSSGPLQIRADSEIGWLMGQLVFTLRCTPHSSIRNARINIINKKFYQVNKYLRRFSSYPMPLEQTVSLFSVLMGLQKERPIASHEKIMSACARGHVIDLTCPDDSSDEGPQLQNLNKKTAYSEIRKGEESFTFRSANFYTHICGDREWMETKINLIHLQSIGHEGPTRCLSLSCTCCGSGNSSFEGHDSSQGTESGESGTAAKNANKVESRIDIHSNRLGRRVGDMHLCIDKWSKSVGDREPPAKKRHCHDNKDIDKRKTTWAAFKEKIPAPTVVSSKTEQKALSSRKYPPIKDRLISSSGITPNLLEVTESDRTLQESTSQYCDWLKDVLPSEAFVRSGTQQRPIAGLSRPPKVKLSPSSKPLKSRVPKPLLLGVKQVHSAPKTSNVNVQGKSDRAPQAYFPSIRAPPEEPRPILNKGDLNKTQTVTTPGLVASVPAHTIPVVAIPVFLTFVPVSNQLCIISGGTSALPTASSSKVIAFSGTQPPAITQNVSWNGSSCSVPCSSTNRAAALIPQTTMFVTSESLPIYVNHTANNTHSISTGPANPSLKKQVYIATTASFSNNAVSQPAMAVSSAPISILDVGSSHVTGYVNDIRHSAPSYNFVPERYQIGKTQKKTGQASNSQRLGCNVDYSLIEPRSWMSHNDCGTHVGICPSSGKNHGISDQSMQTAWNENPTVNNAPSVEISSGAPEYHSPMNIDDVNMTVNKDALEYPLLGPGTGETMEGPCYSDVNQIDKVNNIQLGVNVDHYEGSAVEEFLELADHQDIGHGAVDRLLLWQEIDILENRQGLKREHDQICISDDEEDLR